MESKEGVGYFLFSMDTELATGYFDSDITRRKRFSSNGKRERISILRLIDLFEQYKISGTWAVVGHLFFEKCEYCDVCPMVNWKGKYSSFEEVYGTNNKLWYGADIVEALLTKKTMQEIAFHGYSHNIFDESQISPEQARIEIQEWVRVAKRKGVIANAAVFPRHVYGYLDKLKEAGFICYRGQPNRLPLIQNKVFGRYIKAIDQILGLSNIPIFDMPNYEERYLINLCASQYFFDLNRRFELILDSINLHNLRFRKTIQGIQRAAKEKKIIHIWAHPCDFINEKDFMKLSNLFASVAEEVNRGRMRSVGMTEMARIIINQNNESHKNLNVFDSTLLNSVDRQAF